MTILSPFPFHPPPNVRVPPVRQWRLPDAELRSLCGPAKVGWLIPVSSDCHGDLDGSILVCLAKPNLQGNLVTTRALVACRPLYSANPDLTWIWDWRRDTLVTRTRDGEIQASQPDIFQSTARVVAYSSLTREVALFRPAEEDRLLIARLARALGRAAPDPDWERQLVDFWPRRT